MWPYRLLWIVVLGGGVACGLPLHLMAVFPGGGAATGPLARALRKAVSDADSALVEQDVGLLATPVFLGPRDPLQALCDALEQQRPPPAVLLSFAEAPLSFYVSLVAGYARIPVVGMTRAYFDQPARDVNPFYVSLDPSAEDLAQAAGIFLQSNGWTDAVIIRDQSTFYRDFARELRARYLSGEGQPLEVGDHVDDSRLLQVVAEVPRSPVRVLVVACGPAVSERLFRQARRANLLDGTWIWILVESAFSSGLGSGQGETRFPAGVLGLRLRNPPLQSAAVRAAVQAVTHNNDFEPWTSDRHFLNYSAPVSCWFGPGDRRAGLADFIYRSTLQRRQSNSSLRLPHVFDIYNLVPGSSSSGALPRQQPPPQPARRWRKIGSVTGSRLSLNAVLWPSGTRVGPPQQGQPRYRVVTAYAPPFVMPATRVDNGSCLLGLPCLQVHTRSKVELSRLFADFAKSRSLEGIAYNVSCCAGIAIDLMRAVARDLGFQVDLYLVADGYFGTKRSNQWNGMTLDVSSGAAHMAFSAFSMTGERARIIEYSVPFYHSGVSCLTFTQERDVPLSAFLVPFSVQLWIAIFASLNTTAIVAAVYEWLSPFGLNPWGRMRSKNFSLASALWVMWSLLFSHLVAFKAPKSWPNKVLINLWGCFSVIFVSSYTANIAAHFAGLFFHLRVDDFHDASLLNQRTGTTKGTSGESYIYAENPELWQHIQKYGVDSLQEGLEKLRRGELDVLIGDTVVLDYFRGNDPGCGLHLLGQSIFDDAYAVGMRKGFPLKEAISKLILRYSEHGFMEQLQKKWFGRVPCFNHSVHRLNKPKPLSLGAVAGVFVMLVVGLLVGIVILVIEHMVFKHALPQLRKKPPECFWKSPNLMFFSQKLYRFINTVELVSPHHSAKEIVTNLKEGQIFSLFQKSVKRKAKEEARRRKSKSQFFEMIQEIRNVVRIQREQRRNPIAATAHPQTHALLSEGSSSPPDKQRLLFVPPASPHNNSWTDLYRRAPSALFGAGTRYAPLQQHASPPPPPPRRDESPADAVLSISVEDLRLRTPPRAPGTVRRHRSLGDVSREAGTPPPPSPPKEPPSPPHGVDALVLYSMSKEEIVRRWRASERRLLNRLRDALREKQALERRLVFIQKTLLKPP